MIRVNQLKLSLDREESDLPERAAWLLRIPISAVTDWHIHRKAVDARKKTDVHFVYSIDVAVSGNEEKILAKAKTKQAVIVHNSELKLPICSPPELPPVVVGCGPAGLSAALVLARMGMRPIVIERGRPADERVLAVERFWQDGVLQPDNNVQFGEGGAGTFSDGKLTTGIKSPYIPYILRELADCGGGEEILYEAKPHMGTDRLQKVVTELRRRIKDAGGQVWFSHTLVDWKESHGRLSRLIVDSPEGKKEIPCSACILAIGHSARDTLELLRERGIPLLPKPFAMGVRIEHSQEFIDRSQYGLFAGHPALPAATYKMALHLPSGHTAYTFCMCPGGRVIAAASEAGGVVTNGMSNAGRDEPNANSAVLISLAPADLPRQDDVLAGMYWQRELEQRCFIAAGSDYRAPAQIAADFLAERSPRGPGKLRGSYLPGLCWMELDGMLPPVLTDNLRLGLAGMDKLIPGFAGREAILIAPESRSSSPIRIQRDDFCQTALAGLFCCGEGAGYAGGIMSSAADGMRCALSVAQLISGA